MTSYKNKPVFIYKGFLHYQIWMMVLSLIHYLYFTPDFWINQILEAFKKEINGNYWMLCNPSFSKSYMAYSENKVPQSVCYARWQ